MNFLGHLYFSFDNSDLQHANLFGDFVKGSDLTNYPGHIQKGIQLHREIDSFTDQHDAVRACLHNMYQDLPKISGIAIDMIFDHLLAKNWADFHSLSLRQFVDRFYKSTPQSIEYFSTAYLIMLERMQQEDWLYQYQFFAGFEKACHNFSKRIPFDNVLYATPVYFIKHETDLTKAFYQFMQDAKPHLSEFAAKQGIHPLVEK